MSEWIQGIDAYEVMGTRVETDGTLPGHLPTASVTIAVSKDDARRARDVLLGGNPLPTGGGIPMTWPSVYGSIEKLYCVSAVRRNVQGAFSVQSQELLATDWVFLDLQYTARLGKYVIKTSENIAYYVEDSLEPRFESRPLNHTHYEWYTLLSGQTLRSPVSSNEAPIKTLSGLTLVHKVSGFLTLPDDSVVGLQGGFESLMGTVADRKYTSPNLSMDFFLSYISAAEGTLMLRTINVVQEYSHNSYIGNQPTFTLICRYEYKREGWNLFWRPKLSTNGDWDYMRNSNSGVTQTFFPMADHSTWLF